MCMCVSVCRGEADSIFYILPNILVSVTLKRIYRFTYVLRYTAALHLMYQLYILNNLFTNETMPGTQE